MLKAERLCTMPGSLMRLSRKKNSVSTPAWLAVLRVLNVLAFLQVPKCLRGAAFSSVLRKIVHRLPLKCGSHFLPSPGF